MDDREGISDATSESVASGTLFKRDFWSKENLKYSKPHYRMEKMARLINKLARGRDRTLLDIGCGPAALMSLLQPNIHYYGVDIAIGKPAPNLIEEDFLAAPISFRGRRFDIVVAQGVFEYVGDFQSQKFAEIVQTLNDDGVFVVSYVNFGHRHPDIYAPYSNVQRFEDFRGELAEHFEIVRCFPTSYNWNHWEPGRRSLRAVNMHWNFNVPVIGSILAVEYFVICSPLNH